MLSLNSLPIAAVLAGLSVVRAQYSATYSPGSLPGTTEDGQSGTNQCGGGSSDTSMCQNLYVNSIDDFCLFAPPTTQPIGNAERETVSYCLKSGYGTRLIPSGSINSAHFVQTPAFVQVTGGGSLEGMNIAANDDGGELDPHGADGLGNPIGGLVFTTAFTGSPVQAHEWTQFIGSGYFCIRVCQDGGDAPSLCNHIYDVLGCGWNMPGDYSQGFDSCQGDTPEPMGVYGGSTFYQGQAQTPDAHPPISTYNCNAVQTIGGGNAAAVTGVVSNSASGSVTISGSNSVSTSAATGSGSGSSSASSASVTGSASASGSSSGLGSSSLVTSRTSGTSSRATGTTSGTAAAQSSTGAGVAQTGSIASLGWVVAGGAALLGGLMVL